MKNLIKELAEDFKYLVTEEGGKGDIFYTKGEYTFESTYMGSDFTILCKFEDAEVIEIDLFFDCKNSFIPEGLHSLIVSMVKLLVKDGFIDYKENNL